MASAKMGTRIDPALDGAIAGDTRVHSDVLLLASAFNVAAKKAYQILHRSGLKLEGAIRTGERAHVAPG